MLTEVCASREASQEDVQYAADLAAWFSKAREAGRLEVTMCPAGTVKRPKGGRPGQAIVPSEQV